MSPLPTNPRYRGRRGVTSVELAMIAAPLFILAFASVEFGRAMMAIQTLEEAARSGCRIAVLKSSTIADVNNEIQRVTDAAGIVNYHTQIQPASLAKVPQWDPVVVRISAQFSDMSWLPLPQLFAEKVYTASCVLPREANLDL